MHVTEASSTAQLSTIKINFYLYKTSCTAGRAVGLLESADSYLLSAKYATACL